MFSSDQFYKRQLFIYFAASDSSDPPTDENDGIPMDNHDGSKTTEKPADGSNLAEKLDRSKSADKQVQSKSMDKHDTTSDGQEKFSCSLCITDGLKDGLVW